MVRLPVPFDDNVQCRRKLLLTLPLLRAVIVSWLNKHQCRPNYTAFCLVCFLLLPAPVASSYIYSVTLISENLHSTMSSSIHCSSSSSYSSSCCCYCNSSSSSDILHSVLRKFRIGVLLHLPGALAYSECSNCRW